MPDIPAKAQHVTDGKKNDDTPHRDAEPDRFELANEPLATTERRHGVRFVGLDDVSVNVRPLEGQRELFE
jgi:hypothetical protein